MITHDNIVWTTACTIHRRLPPIDQTERFISYLPLSHIAAQIIDIHAPMCLVSFLGGEGLDIEKTGDAWVIFDSE